MDRPMKSTVVTSTSDDGVLSANPTLLHRVVVGVVEAATVIALYDDTTASGPTGKIAEISCATLGSYDLGSIACRKGLVAITTATGTARVSIVTS